MRLLEIPDEYARAHRFKDKFSFIRAYYKRNKYKPVHPEALTERDIEKLKSFEWDPVLI